MFQENRVKPHFSPNGPFQSSDQHNGGLAVRRPQPVLAERSPANTAFELIEYWHDSTALYPGLANAALTLLFLANGSRDAEGTFFQLRYVQQLDTSRHVAHADDNPRKQNNDV